MAVPASVVSSSSSSSSSLGFGITLYGIPSIMESALQFIWFWPISCVNSIWGAIYSHLNSPGSIQQYCLRWCTPLLSHLPSWPILPYTGRVRNPVVGHESNGPQVVFNVHQSQGHDSTHPSLFYQVGYHSYIYMWSAAQLGIVMHHTFGAMPVGGPPIHVLTGFMIA